MNVVDRITSWLGLDNGTKPRSEKQMLLDLIEAGQRAERTEQYEIALGFFTRAVREAESQRDFTTAASTSLRRAEVFIQQGDWSAAESLLLQLRHTAQTTGQHPRMAQILCALGTLAQAQGDWGEARAYYEQALKVGRTANSLPGEARALGHLADTYLHENNASYAVHLLREAVPKLNMSGDLALSSYFVGRLGEALIATGQDSEGERLLYRGLRLAEQISDRRLARRWSLALGERMLDTMRYEEAQKHFEQALALFPAEAIQPGRVAALAHLSRVCLYLHQPEKALQHAQQAVRAAESLPDDPHTQALAGGALGIALRFEGRHVPAITHLESAAGYYQQMNGAAASAIHVEVLRNLAAAQASIADTEAAIITYNKALAQARLADAPLELAQTHVDFGLLYLQRREMQAAVDQWTAAQAIYIEQHQHTQVARLYCDIAGARKYLGQGQRAIRDYEQALMTLNAVEDWATRGLVVSNAAIAYADMGEIESADAFFSEAITIASRLGDRSAEAVRRGNYGWFLLATGRPHQAVATLEHALRLSEQIGHSLQLAVQTSNLAQAHEQLANYAAAQTYHDQAHALLPHVHDPHWRSMIHINLANALLRRDLPDEALPLLEQALAEGRANHDVEVIASALIAQARLALSRREADTAGTHITEAVALARRADMRRLLASALHVHSEQQAASDQPAQAQALWDEALRLYTVLRAPQASETPGWLVAQSS